MSFHVNNSPSDSGERAKNGGVLGEEIFCPRAVGFFCPPPQAAGTGFFQEFLIK